MVYIFNIYSSFEGYFDCFCFLSIVIGVNEHWWASICVVGWWVLCVDAKKWCSQSYGRFIFRFIRICHTYFQSGGTNLQSYREKMMVSSSPQSVLCLLSAVFLNLPILAGVRWNLKVIWIWIWGRYLVWYF